MGIHRLTKWVLALAALFALSGCAGSPAAGDASSQPPPAVSAAGPAEDASPKLPFTLPYYPDYSIHPALAENRANLTLAPLLYEGLFSVDSRFQATPQLCESYFTSEDGLSWTFTLRPGVTFSDGTPLTGKLAAQALNTALGEGSRFAGRIPGLRSITGSDQTVTVNLSQPNGSLPTLLDIPLAKDGGSRPAGTGAYVLTTQGDQPLLTARSDWWQKKALPFPTIRLSCIQQADDLISAFDAGDVTLLDADLTGTNTLGYSGSYEVWDYNTTDFIFLGFNTARGYFQDPQARQAVGRGLDREAIATIPYARHAAAATLPIHPDSPLYDAELAEQAGYDPDVLAATLREHPPQRALTLLVNSENSAKLSAALYVAEQLQAAGLAVHVDKRPWNDFLAALSAGQFDFYLGEVLLTPDFDLTALLSSSGPLNYSRWRNEQTDQLLSALRASSVDQRPAAAKALYQHLGEQAPILPICFKHGSVLTQWGRLSGLQPRQEDVFYALDQWKLDP